MYVRIVDEYYTTICTIVIREISDLNSDDEMHVIINGKKIPFKVITDGGFKSLRKINYIERKDPYPDIELHGLISNIYSFDELRRLVG